MLFISIISFTLFINQTCKYTFDFRLKSKIKSNIIASIKLNMHVGVNCSVQNKE